MTDKTRIRITPQRLLTVVFTGLALPAYLFVVDPGFRPATRGGEFWAVMLVMWLLGAAMVGAIGVWVLKQRALKAERDGR